MSTSILRTSLRSAQSSIPRPCRHTPLQSMIRYNSSSASTSKTASPTPSQQLYTLNEIDKLTTSIAQSSSGPIHHPSPLVMRALPAPWLSSQSPDLASQGDTCSVDPHTSSAEPFTEEELLRPRHMSESFTSFDLPLASDAKLYERYVNTSGGFRMGKLLEHLDSLAGAVAYRHCLPTPKASQSTEAQAFHESSSRAGLYLATASADRLDMFGRLNRENVRDLKFSGFVTWTGRSSLEVVVKMEGHKPSEQSGHDKTLMLGRFAMVCRDSKTHKARQVPRLLVESEEEKVLWAIGEEHQKRRKTSAMAALDKVPPSSAEAEELHKLMLQVSTKEEVDGEQVVPMQDTEIQTVQLMFPQDRNLHGKVFGGILMRLAFELCFTNAALFSQAPMRFLALDQITFRLPVPIGAVLRLSSKVVKTTKPHEGPDGEAKVHIMVRAEVEEVDTGVRRETNTFFFTMAKEDDKPIGRTVIPSTYAEAMHYLEGKRRLEVGDEMRRLYQVGQSQ
uniref:Thioesterase n=1 Tax=Kwoniella bestiolae CBS 10118 TaxID=1296100 RepID=A0A1B9GA94_9TREE|nr:thioesterase [Kwoniella bestiolae CBS 10118]OCF27931.1 thioesterase [Kwoniella bestiolae CBS 10118]